MIMAFNRGILLAVLVFVAAAGMLVGGASAATYVVGDSLGWTVPPSATAYPTWASQHVFAVGDVLVFNFTTGFHSAAKVDSEAYRGCSSTNPIALATLGPASFTLNSTGADYYICTFGQHCSLGQRLAINVTTSSSPPPAPAPIPVPTPPSSAPPPAPATTPSPSVVPLPTPSLSPSSPTPPEAPSPAGSGTSPSPSAGPASGPGTGAGPAGAPGPGTGAGPAGAPGPGTGAGPAGAPGPGTGAGPAGAPGPGTGAGPAGAPGAGPAGAPGTGAGSTGDLTPPPPGSSAMTTPVFTPLAAIALLVVGLVM